MSTKTKTTVTEELEMGAVSGENPEVKIAVMNADIKHMNDTLVRIEGKFDNAMTGFVTVDKLADAQAAATTKHVEIDRAINKLENWNTWAVRIVFGAIVSIVVYFIGANYQHLLK